MQIYTVRISPEIVVVMATVSQNMDYTIRVNKKIVRVSLQKVHAFCALRLETERVIIIYLLK